MANKTNTSTSQDTAAVQDLPASQVSQDLKHALLIVSLVLNLAVFATWLAVQITSQYNAQLGAFLNIG